MRYIYFIIIAYFLISCNQKHETESSLFVEAIDTYFQEKYYSDFVETNEIGLESRSWKIKLNDSKIKYDSSNQIYFYYDGEYHKYPPPPNSSQNRIGLNKLEFRTFLTELGIFDSFNSKYISNHFKSKSYNFNNYNFKNVNVITFDSIIEDLGFSKYLERLFNENLYYTARISAPLLSIDKQKILFFLQITNQTMWSKGCFTFDPKINIAVLMVRKNNKWVFQKQIFLT